MMRIGMSPAAAGLLRALINRACIARDRILLTEFRSTDWHSLTFCGERHRFSLRLAPPDAGEIFRRVIEGLSDAEFAIPGHVVADITVAEEPRTEADGSIVLEIEALTVAED